MAEATSGSTTGAGIGGADDDGLHLGDAIDLFLSAKRAGGRSGRTIDEYRKKLDLFQRWAAPRISGEGAVDAPYGEVGADEVEAYVVHLKERGLSDTSRKGHLAVLRSFFKTVSKRTGLPDPTDGLDEVRFHQKAPKRSYLTKREAEILLSTVERAATGAEGTDHDGAMSPRAARRAAVARTLAARDHAAFSAMIYAGLRIEEATALEVGDLSFSRGDEEVRVARGKGNKERLVPMSAKLKRSLRRYLRVRDELVPVADSPPPHLFLNEKGKRVTENTVRRRLYSWVRKSGIKKRDVKPHDLRRTFATWFLQENPDKFVELAGLMGHSDLSQVMKYALSDAERARAGVGRL
jgi:integrase/recombinase XerD